MHRVRDVLGGMSSGAILFREGKAIIDEDLARNAASAPPNAR
jgi:hypothetical protein